MLGRTADGRAACRYPAYRETLPGGVSYIVLDQVDTAQADDFPATRVPAGRLFLMGDNRDDSADSRFALDEQGVGMVPVENLVGRATGDLLVDRRRRLLLEAVDLVHRAARRTASATAIRDARNERGPRRLRPRQARPGSRATSSCSSAR